MKKVCILFCGMLLALAVGAQNRDTLSLNVGHHKLHAVLTTPVSTGISPLALIIAGSGPTDLDGNNPVMKNNSLRLLSDALVAENIATLRFDKFGIAGSAVPGFNEADLTIDLYAEDVVALINQMHEKGFQDIYLLGHSEGSLIGLLALQKVQVKGFVSIAGAGFPAGDILKKQLKPQLPPDLYNQTVGLIDSLKNGFKVSSAPRMLYSLFRPSVQPYMISWLKCSPVDLLASFDGPTLIIQGDQDLQITADDARQLAQAARKGNLVIIKGMNHVLKTISGGVSENQASYSNPDLPVNTELTKSIIDFIK